MQSIGDDFVPSRLNALRIFLFSLLIILPACSLWDSMTAYFNTFYNAQRLFTEAETELWQQKDAAAYGRNYYLAPMQSANRTKFTSVIEKCSKLLQYHGESNLVNDALLMIGMSYYYQSDFQQADRKFRELLDRTPDGTMALQARLMRGYAAYRSGGKDSAEVLAREVLDRAESEEMDLLIGQSSLLLGQIERDRLNSRGATRYYVRAGETAENPELRTSAYLTGAGILDTLGAYASAESLYQRAQGVTQTYAGEFRGKFGVARMRGRQGDRARGLEMLEELRDNSNYKEFFPEIDLEIGHIYRAGGEIASAIEQYKYVDTAYVRTESAQRAGYALGMLYENEQLNYDSAYVAYQRGRGHGLQFPISPAINLRTEAFARLLQLRRELSRGDSVREAAVALRDSLLARPDSTRRAPSIDSIDQRIATTRGELATIFFLSLEKNDSAAYWYRRLIADAPGHPSVPRALFTLAQLEGGGGEEGKQASDSLYREIIRRFPQSDFADEAKRILGLPVEMKVREEGEAEYHRVERLLLDGKSEEAIAGFRQVAERFPASPFAPRAQYAIGWTYENNLHRPDSAIANYQALVSRFPTSPLVVQVRPKLIEVQNYRAGLKADSAAAKKPPSTLTPAQEEEIRRERAPAPKPPAEKPPTVKPSDERLPVEKSPAEKAPGEKPSTEKVPGEKPSTEKVPGEKPSTEKVPGEKPSTEKVPAEKAPAPRLPEPQQDGEKLPGGFAP